MGYFAEERNMLLVIPNLSIGLGTTHFVAPTDPVHRLHRKIHPFWGWTVAPSRLTRRNVKARLDNVVGGQHHV
jgi:hypothetical protein